MSRKIVLSAILATILMVGCKKFEGNVTVPSFLQIDSVAVVKASTGELGRSEGWYTSNIDAVQLTAYFDGDGSETDLGVFQLPCKNIPVLRHGKMAYLRVTPVVKQNGIAATRIAYPFLQTVQYTNLELRPEEVTGVGRKDAVSGKYVVEVSYYGSTQIATKFFEDFELPETEIRMGPTPSVVHWDSLDADAACVGKGCGRVHSTRQDAKLDFEILDTINLPNPSSVVYLEMDYRTDVELHVGIRSRSGSSDREESYDVMTLYPCKRWNKIYINLGKLWSQFNHYPHFHVFFYTLNTEEIEGDTYLDNVKVISL